ncbi:leucine-rich repeat-containing protein 28-like isoform X2 [Palaemon carinicauda]
MKIVHLEDTSQDITEQQVTELLAEVRHQTILHWNYRRLKVLPQRVLEECSHIHQIYLKRNLLTSLPDSIGCLSQLTYCYLHGNNLQSLPDSIGELVSLQVLDIGNNKIKNLPTSIGKLPSLRSLVAVYNQITCFPKELCNLKTLSVLMLSSNSLFHLPEAIGGLTALQGLYVDHNHIRELPRSIVSLPLLTRISCCCNSLTHLPALNFTSKPTVFFDDNPLMNYLPFSLMQELRTGESWDPVVLQTCGCFQESVIVNNSVFVCTSKTTRNDDPKCLTLPPQLNKISAPNKGFTVSPLFELCLRSVWKEKRRIFSANASRKTHFGTKFDNLSLRSVPPNIHCLLQVGPVSYCNYERCKCPVFTYCSIKVITVRVTQRPGRLENIVPTVLYFCCDTCNVRHQEEVRIMRDNFSLWLNRQLENACMVQV